MTRHAKKIPAPTAYSKELSWLTPNGKFSGGAKRTTFTDDAAKHSKQVPSAAAYTPKLNSRLLLGQLSKTEGINYLSDH